MKKFLITLIGMIFGALIFNAVEFRHPTLGWTPFVGLVLAWSMISCGLVAFALADMIFGDEEAA
jgi:hypothetical protein